MKVDVVVTQIYRTQGYKKDWAQGNREEQTRYNDYRVYYRSLLHSLGFCVLGDPLLAVNTNTSGAMALAKGYCFRSGSEKDTYNIQIRFHLGVLDDPFLFCIHCSLALRSLLKELPEDEH